MSPVTKITDNRNLAALVKRQKNVAASIKAVYTNLHANPISLKANIDAVNENINRLELLILELEGRVVDSSDAEAAQQYVHNVTTLRAACNAHMENYEETVTTGKIIMNDIEQVQASLKQQIDRLYAEMNALATDYEERARALKG